MTACGSFNHVDEWLMAQDDQEELIQKGPNIDHSITLYIFIYILFEFKVSTYRGYNVNDSFKALRLRKTVKEDYIEDVAKFNYERFWLDLNHHIEKDS